MNDSGNNNDSVNSNSNSNSNGNGNRAGSGNNIVIVGGGFAGTTLARSLERRLPAGHYVVPARYAPPIAPFAVTQAHTLAHNPAARIAQRPTRAFAHVSKGVMATTGHLNGVAQVGGVRFTRTSEVDADAALPPTHPAHPMHPVLASTSSAASVSPSLSQVQPQLRLQPQT